MKWRMTSNDDSLADAVVTATATRVQVLGTLRLQGGNKKLPMSV